MSDRSQLPVVRPALDREAPLPRRRHHLARRRGVARVGGVDAEARRAPPRPGSSRIDVALRRASAAASSHVATDRCATSTPGTPRGAAPAGGRDDVPTDHPGREPSRRPAYQGRRADRRASGTAPITRSSSSSAGQILRRMHREVDLARRAAPRRSCRSTAPSARAGTSSHRPAGLRHRTSSSARAARRRPGLEQRGEPRSACASARSDRRVPIRSVVTARRRESRPRSSASSLACTRSVPGSIRSFIATIGSCRSFAADAARERLDGVALVGREIGEPASAALELAPAPRRRRGRGAPGSAARARRRGDARPIDGPPRRRSRGRARSPRPSAASRRRSGRAGRRCRSPARRSSVRGLGLDVARHGQVEQHERPAGAAAPSRDRRSACTDHVAGRAGRRDDEVGVARARAGSASRSPCSAFGPFGQRARVLQRAVQDPDRPDASAAGGASRRARPSRRRRSRPSAARRARPAPRPRDRCRARRTRRAPRRATSPGGPGGRRASPRGTGRSSAGPAASSASATAERLAHLRRGSASRRAPSSRARRDREQVVGRVALPVGVEGLGELRRARRRASRSSTA